MKSHASIRIAAWCCLAVAPWALHPACADGPKATTIIEDVTFAADGTLMNGRTPQPVDLPDGAWVNGNSPNVIQGNRVVAGNDGALGVSITSAGEYTKPKRFTISADLDLNEMRGPDNPQDTLVGDSSTYPRGITLGFFNVEGPLTTDSLTLVRRAPYGVTYNDTGALLLVVADAGNVAADVLAVVTTYGPDHRSIPMLGTHHLSYSVDTATGSISDVTFDGYAIDFGVKTTRFTDANTNVAGVYGASGLGNTYGFMSNFLITSVVPGAAAGSPRTP